MKKPLHFFLNLSQPVGFTLASLLLFSSCAMPNLANKLPPVTTESTPIKQVVCPSTANTVHLRFEGEDLPESYDKYALVSSRSELNVEDAVHIMYLKQEASKRCANEIIFLKSEEKIYNEYHLDNPLTLIDESELPSTVREKLFSGVAIYNPELAKNSIVDTNYVVEIRDRELKYAQYLNELEDLRSSARGAFVIGTVFALVVFIAWLENNKDLDGE